MRIIGGSLKGKTIIPPAGLKARPTTDFAKEGLFNVLTNEVDFEETTVLDLFAGTGSISYEFASRGCKEIVAVEMNTLQADFIRKTAVALGLSALTIVRHNVFDFINICTRSFDIVFADPPYQIVGLYTIPDRIIEHNMLADNGYLILEHPNELSFTEHPCFVKEKRYGNVHFSFFKKV
ncbi:MAG: methyltransferase domain-containing protein [Bacteroidales bacterium]|jgi:16S rRNA (guanine966-N2)-methyltransferase|nr:methyltransferase domain-containing protein [Bacteroidales bacterium]